MFTFRVDYIVDKGPIYIGFVLVLIVSSIFGVVMFGHIIINYVYSSGELLINNYL